MVGQHDEENMKKLIGLMVLAVVAGCVSDTGSTRASLTGPELADLIAADSPLMTMDDAIAIAQMEAPAGAILAVIELDIEEEDGEPIAWDSLFYVGGELLEVEVGGFDGAILEVEDEGSAEADPTGYIGVARARELATAEYPGFVLAVEAEVEENDEAPHYDVMIFAEGQETDFVEVELDALTGEIVEVEFETEYEDD